MLGLKTVLLCWEDSQGSTLCPWLTSAEELEQGDLSLCLCQCPLAP